MSHDGYGHDGHDGYGRSPSRGRDYSPDYYSGGANYNAPYASGAIPVFGDPPPRFSTSLQVPVAPQRPRSVPPISTAVARRRRSRSRSRSRSSSRSSDRSNDRPRTPLGKAREAVKDNFTNSKSGLGVSLLGALVGGLAAREASDASARRHNKKLSTDDRDYRPRGSKERERTKMISTIAGAVIGGLGANAIEKKFETARERDMDQQEAWERKWGKEGDLPHYDTGNHRELDHGRGRGRRDREYSYTEDYVYDSRRESQRNRSEDGFRYRN